MAGSKNRKRKAANTATSIANSSAWKDVDVTLGGGIGDKESDHNHYDDDDDDDTTFSRQTPTSSSSSNNNRKRAAAELEAAPGEPVGMFYGLQVIDGASYKVQTGDGGATQFSILNTNTSNDEDGGGEEAKDANAKPAASTETKPKKTRRSNDAKPAASDETTTSEATAPVVVEQQQQQTKAEKQAAIEAQKKDKALRKKQKKARVQAEIVAKAALRKGKGSKAITETAAVVPEPVAVSKKSKQKQPQPSSNTTATADKAVAVDSAKVQALQSSWILATAGVTLHETLCSSLLKQEFWTPTPIQAAVLPAAVLGRRNIVGAAPTGSGKTLAFLVPIFQTLLERQDAAAVANDDQDDDPTAQDKRIQALILTPTRELALQIHKEAEKLLPNKAGLICGGFAHAKQYRVLSKNRPAVIVATPGRLWELISSGEHEHLNDLSQIRFLVIDEADRMVQQGGFKELENILDAVQAANPMDEDDSDDEEDGDGGGAGEADMDRMFGLPGIPGEAKVRMLSDDILQQLAQQRGDDDEMDVVEPPTKEVDDEEFEEMADDDDAESDGEISLPAEAPVYRQTFVYSATLTLPSSINYKKKRNSKAGADIDGAIAELLEKARAKGKTKVVDLTNADKSGKVKTDTDASDGARAKAVSKSQFRLPPGLTLRTIKCIQRHKDSHLYAYLMTTEQGSSGPCLVFCNSIAAVRRVGTTLETLGLPVRFLHAQMQQRQRLKAVESLRDSKDRTIVVATDVAARGLDIPSVATVVHYDGARNIDTFVHRSGRTARGVGKAAVGLSLSLIAPSEDKSHARLVASLEAKFEDVIMDSRLLNASEERVNLASKVVMTSDQEQKTNRANQWFKDSAAQAGLEIDDNCLDEGLAGGDLRDRSRLREAQKARVRLRELLQQPMQTQRYGKFLSTNTAARRNGVVPAAAVVRLPSAGQSVKGPRKNRRIR